MRRLTDQYRLQALSLPEITDAVDRLILRYGRSIKFQGRKLRPGPMLNAVMLHFLSLSEEEQERALAAAIARLEAMLTEAPAAAAPAEAPQQTVLGHDEDPPAAPSRRRQRG